ncbi:hypothetical protein KIPB_001585 [Kipferlia bialata]|uniref:Uncharacterized protein n=1 Tax=Kipferlia bialata TaxID=797122 RepID=A0A9K3GFA5_9EUKA|nr:hypothetical protein KIPB_001585 [Kipferlia bialata]|eukprot:g1585.t1
MGHPTLVMYVLAAVASAVVALATSGGSGYIVQITDAHIDPYYAEGTSLDSRCTLNGKDYKQVVNELRTAFPSIRTFHQTNVRRRGDMLLWLPRHPSKYTRGALTPHEMMKLRNSIM